MLAHRDRLLDRGIYYPKAGLRGSAHHGIGFDLLGDPRFDPLTGGLAEAVEEFSKVDAETILISSEELAFLTLEELQRLKAAFPPDTRFKILIYLRRQDLWLQSLWTMWVKTGFSVDTMEDFISKAIGQEIDENDTLSEFILVRSDPDYSRRIIRWEQVFGKENLVVRVFEKGQIRENNIIVDFLSAIGEDDLDLQVDTMKNISPSAKTLEVIRYYVKWIGVVELKVSPCPNSLVAQFIQWYADRHGWNGNKFNGITKEIYDTLMERYAESNREIANRYFGRDELYLEPFNPLPITKFHINLLKDREATDLSIFVVKQLTQTKRALNSIAERHGYDLVPK